MNLRAGSGVVFSNVVSGANDNSTAGENLYEEDSGYPASYQIGRGKNGILDPAYCWANDKLPTSGSGNVTDGVDFYSNTVKPGYTPYTYPHPLVSGTNAPSTWTTTQFGGKLELNGKVN